MIFVLDIGNTRSKLALFENNSLSEVFYIASEKILENILMFLDRYPKTTDLVVSSVAKWGNEDFKILENRVRVQFIQSNTPTPFTNCYATPTTLGIDRLILVSGAVLRFPNQNRLIIDAGTCITYDFVDLDNNYLGGAIAPGLMLRYKSLHDYTNRLPLLELQSPEHLIGDSTAASIHSGVVMGTLNEIDGNIQEYQKLYPNLTVILTGGDSIFLAKRLKSTIFAHSNFLLESLNALHHYLNTENDKKNNL